jgi:hypothetical protein
MTERRLPPALEEDKYHPGLVRTIDLLDWLYGPTRPPGYEGPIPGLVERVARRAIEMVGHNGMSEVVILDALRAELGIREAQS